MNSRLREPGGTLGVLSLVSTYVLACFGILGVVTTGAALVLGTDWWSDTRSNQVFGLVFFALVLAGAYGFVIMDQRRVLGTVLAVIGGVALATILMWAVLPIVLGLGAAVVAVLRSRALPDATAAPAPG